jgi:hypothetical protein
MAVRAGPTNVATPTEAVSRLNFQFSNVDGQQATLTRSQFPGVIGRL